MRPYYIIPEISEGLKRRLNNPQNLSNEFWDAQNWIKETCGVKVNYRSLWGQIAHKLNGNLKKEHYKKKMMKLKA